MREIYSDFNDIASDGTLPLTCAGSLTSIAELKDPLTDGEVVWLRDGDLRVKGRVYWRQDGSWEARSDWQFAR